MLVLDIETYKDLSDVNYTNWKLSNISAPSNYKDPSVIERYVTEQKSKESDKFALSPLTGKIILIGLLTDKVPPLNENDFSKYLIDNKEVYYIGITGEERHILTTFWKLFAWFGINDSILVTYNGKEFDLPFIIKRTLIVNAEIDSTMKRIDMNNYLMKYKNTPHLDLYNWLGSGSLVEWSYRLGLSDSLQRDGNKIGGWYEQGQMETIINKNKLDVAQSYSIYNKIEGLI